MAIGRHVMAPDAGDANNDDGIDGNAATFNPEMDAADEHAHQQQQQSTSIPPSFAHFLDFHERHQQQQQQRHSDADQPNCQNRHRINQQQQRQCTQSAGMASSPPPPPPTTTFVVPKPIAASSSCSCAYLCTFCPCTSFPTMAQLDAHLQAEHQHGQNSLEQGGNEPGVPMNANATDKEVRKMDGEEWERRKRLGS